MKKQFLLFILFVTAGLFAFAQTMSVHVSGSVTADSTGAPIPNHEVIISADSSAGGFSYYATRMTNANGMYDCTIQNVPTATAITFTVKTLDCNNVYHVATFLSTNSPAVVNFVICLHPTNCEASFVYYTDTTNLVSVHFNSTSTAGAGSTITGYSWDFGDGTPQGTTKDPWHLYAISGTYTVCLTIVTSNGCTSTHCEGIIIAQGGGGCHAAFRVEGDSLSLIRHFIDLSEGNPTAWHWNFGDPTAGVNNTSTIQNPTFVYTYPGVYYICLSISKDSCQDTHCDSIFVAGNTTNCESWFTFSKSFLTVHFEGHTHSLYPTTWAWSFGDPASGSANISTLRVPTHVYSSAGTYNVTLHTVDSTGCEYTSTQSIYVSGTVDLYGVVTAGSNFVDHGFIQLIRADSGNVMTVVNSQEFGDSAGMYWFGGVAPGHYYLKAELRPSSAYYGQYIPTYYTQSLTWTNATLIELGVPQNPYNFHLLHVNGPSGGNGDLSGTISQGTKVNTGGTPAAGVEVLLLDETDKPLTYATTDVNGHFDFPGIALGSYTVYPEVAGMSTSPAHVTLTATNSSLVLPFTMNNGHLLYGINDNLPQYISQVGDIYPNPCPEGNARINITSSRDLGLEITLYYQTGQVARQLQASLHKGVNTLQLDLKDLPQGPYYLRMTSSEGGNIIKKLSLIQ